MAEISVAPATFKTVAVIVSSELVVEYGFAFGDVIVTTGEGN